MQHQTSRDVSNGRSGANRAVELRKRPTWNSFRIQGTTIYHALTGRVLFRHMLKRSDGRDRQKAPVLHARKRFIGGIDAKPADFCIAHFTCVIKLTGTCWKAANLMGLDNGRFSVFYPVEAFLACSRRDLRATDEGANGLGVASLVPTAHY